MNEVRRIDKDSNEYPLLLKEIPDAPKALYYKGTWNSELFDKCIGVVGSRNITIYGKRVVQTLVSEIACFGINIVSGFMYGVDALAHSVAISSGVTTVAVLPCGIDLIYPNSQKELHENILEAKGLFISEFEGEYRSQVWTYYKRNRIIAGLSKALLVVEAGLDSGSLITANFAKKYNRTVMAVPGSIFSEYSLGTLQLIKDGAKTVVTASDILANLSPGAQIDEYVVKDKVATSVLNNFCDKDSVEYRIFELLKDQILTLDQISQALHLPIEVLSFKITLMLIAGIVFEDSGRFFI